MNVNSATRVKDNNVSLILLAQRAKKSVSHNGIILGISITLGQSSCSEERDKQTRDTTVIFSFLDCTWFNWYQFGSFCLYGWDFVLFG